MAQAEKKGFTLYTIRKAKKNAKTDKTHYRTVGTLLIREGGENGVLTLDMFDGDLAVFKKDPKDQGGDEAEGG